jgi:hypothetical protein
MFKINTNAKSKKKQNMHKINGNQASKSEQKFSHTGFDFGGLNANSNKSKLKTC